MLDPLNGWLREQRLARGWSVAEMGRRLSKAAKTSGDHTVPGAALIGSYVRRWESGKSGVSERYRLHYCAALGVGPDTFGSQLPPAGTKASGSAEGAHGAASDVQLRANSLSLLDRRDGDGDADKGASSAETPESLPAAASAGFLMAMIAQESLDFGEWADTSNIGDATLEQYADRVRQLADDYQHAAPFPLLAEAKRLRDQVFTKLRGHQRAGQARELYAIAAQACGLLAWMSADLSFYRAADAHAWTGWVCAEHADHDGARSWVRATQSKIAYWDARYAESLQLAEDGLRYPCPDSGHVMLALFRARALARVGRQEDAALALGSARDALDQADDDLVGGLWSVTPARFHSLAGTVQILRQDSQQALAETSLALDQFEAAAPRQHNYGAEVHARIDRAQAHLLLKDLDGAHAALQPVLELSAERRYEPITQHLGQLRLRLADPTFGDAAVARHTQEEIESYCRESAFRELTH